MRASKQHDAAGVYGAFVLTPRSVAKADCLSVDRTNSTLKGRK
jgi:hypothetical protein